MATRQTKKEREELKQESIKILRKMIRPGQKVYVTCSHVARSGMSRTIHCFVVKKGEIHNISWRVAHAIGWPLNQKSGNGITVGGCGMDMGFQTVYVLSSVLFPKGGKFQSLTRLHQAQRDAKAQGKSTTDVKALRETNGGYLLKHEWL